MWLSNHACRFHIVSNLAMLIPYSRSNGRLCHLCSIVGGGQIYVLVPILLLLPCIRKLFYEVPPPNFEPLNEMAPRLQFPKCCEMQQDGVPVDAINSIYHLKGFSVKFFQFRPINHQIFLLFPLSPNHPHNFIFQM